MWDFLLRLPKYFSLHLKTLTGPDFNIVYLCYVKITHSDWLKLVTCPTTSNTSALFQYSIVVYDSRSSLANFNHFWSSEFFKCEYSILEVKFSFQLSALRSLSHHHLCTFLPWCTSQVEKNLWKKFFVRKKINFCSSNCCWKNSILDCWHRLPLYAFHS